METIEAPPCPLGVHRVADLRLRGPAGSIPVRVRWPRTPGAGSTPPLVVFLPDLAPGDGVDGADDALGHELCSRVGAVVLCIPWAPRRPGALDRAEAALVWAADHGEELGADPGRLVIAGRGAGAAAAAVLALRARERDWPPLRRQVLVLGDAAAQGDTVSAPAVAGAPVPAILVIPGSDHHGRCAQWLRATGAEVEELRGTDPPEAGARTGLAEPLLAGLVRLLRGALEER